MAVDIESFLNPISVEAPCGEYLCYEKVYDDLKELRREDDPRLSQGVWQTDPKKADWPQVIKIASDLLKTKTKDLQVGMWLMDAWIVERQFEGFNDGLKLIQGLCDKFWDNIYPALGTEDNSYRLAPFYFLAEKISERVVLIPLTTTEDAQIYSLADWMDARRNLQIKNAKGLSLKTIGKQVAITSLEMFQKLLTEVTESIELLNKLKAFIYEKCPVDAPSFSTLISYLEDIQRITSKNLDLKQKQRIQMEQKAKLERQKAEAAAKSANAEIVLEEENSSQKEPTIAQAYNAMLEIAIFLERKQPQSPASTLLRVASKIGQKSFQELLELNMQSGVSVLNTISELYSIFYKQNQAQLQEEEDYMRPPQQKPKAQTNH